MISRYVLATLFALAILGVLTVVTLVPNDPNYGSLGKILAGGLSGILFLTPVCIWAALTNWRSFLGKVLLASIAATVGGFFLINKGDDYPESQGLSFLLLIPGLFACAILTAVLVFREFASKKKCDPTTESPETPTL